MFTEDLLHAGSAEAVGTQKERELNSHHAAYVLVGVERAMYSQQIANRLRSTESSKTGQRGIRETGSGEAEEETYVVEKGVRGGLSDKGMLNGGLKKSREDPGKSSAGSSKSRGPELRMCLASLRGILVAVAKGVGMKWEGGSQGVGGAPGALGLFL